MVKFSIYLNRRVFVMWHFLWLELINNNVYTNFYQNIPCSWRPTVIFIFARFEHLASLLARACRYQFVCKNCQNIPYDSRRSDISGNCPHPSSQSDHGRTRWLQSTLRKSTLRYCWLFFGSCSIGLLIWYWWTMSWVGMSKDASLS